MPQYLLLLHDDPSAVRNFASWVLRRCRRALNSTAFGPTRRRAGFYVSSNRLSDDAGRVIRSRSGKARVTDGPFSETKEVLGSYYLIDAANYDEAVQRVLDHPHLAHGGTIEVRQVESLR